MISENFTCWECFFSKWGLVQHRPGCEALADASAVRGMPDFRWKSSSVGTERSFLQSQCLKAIAAFGEQTLCYLLLGGKNPTTEKPNLNRCTFPHHDFKPISSHVYHHASNNLSPDMNVSETAGSMTTIRRMGHHFFEPNLRATRAHTCTCLSWDKKVWDFKSTVTLAFSRTLMLLIYRIPELFSSNFKLLIEISTATVDHKLLKGDGGSGPLQIRLSSEVWFCFTGLFQIPLRCLVC